MGGVWRRRMRLFLLIRNEDVSGVSGTGIVAEGVEFSDGTVAMRLAAASVQRGVLRVNSGRACHSRTWRADAGEVVG
jgi:hypothetical protein